MIPTALRADADALAASIGRTVELLIGDDAKQIGVVVHGADISAGPYSHNHSDVLMLTDSQYPASALDMFWFESDIGFATGAIPSHATAIEPYFGRQWRRWSWHRNGVWTPGVDSLLSHWVFIEACWVEEAANAQVGV